MPESPLPKIHGIIAYPVTPFAADPAATIDTEKLSALVDRLVVAGVHAIAPLGSTGELAYLDEAEFDTVVDTTIAAVHCRVPVVVGFPMSRPRRRPGVRNTHNGPALMP